MFKKHFWILSPPYCIRSKLHCVNRTQKNYKNLPETYLGKPRNLIHLLFHKNKTEDTLPHHKGLTDRIQIFFLASVLPQENKKKKPMQNLCPRIQIFFLASDASSRKQKKKTNAESFSF